MSTRSGKLSTKRGKTNPPLPDEDEQNSTTQDYPTIDITAGKSTGVSDVIDIKESVKNILSDESGLLQPLVSSIVAVVLQTPAIFNPLVEAVTKAISEKTAKKIKADVTQDVYAAVSMDIRQTQNQIDNLKKELDHLRQENVHLESQMDDSQQYSRRNCLLIHGIPEEDGENTTTASLNKINHRLDLQLSPSDIDRSHRLGRPKSSSSKTDTKTRPIILKFISYSHREQVYSAKKGFKGTSIMITESLTPKRMVLYRAAQRMMKEGEIISVWSMDGRIIVLTKNNHKVNIASLSDLDKI